MIFTPIYLVLCIVITCFGHFNVYFYLVGDGQVKRSKNKQKGVKGSKIGQSTRACHDMVSSCRSMRSSNQKPEAGMPQHAMVGQKPDFQSMPQHAESCCSMTTLIGLCYFWQVGFWDSYVILLSLLV